MTIHSPILNLSPFTFAKCAALSTMVLLILLFLPVNVAQADTPYICDIDWRDGSFGCRPVPEYFYENLEAKRRLNVEPVRPNLEIDQRPYLVVSWKPSPLVTGTKGNHGYRCPDAQGMCPNVWVPGATDDKGRVDTSGLSSPDRYAGLSGFDRSSTFVNRISASGIGVKSIVEQGPIDAVDIWGEGAAGGGEVCFYGRGRITFLDARTSPRAESALTTVTKGELTCANTPGPGSVIFLPLV